MNFRFSLDTAYKKGIINEKVRNIFMQLYESYAHSVTQDSLNMAEYEHVFETFLRLVVEQINSPYDFEPFHRRVTSPYDYYSFGIEFIRPLVDKKRSRLLHKENVEKAVLQLENLENVIYFANHQTEVDPQLMSLALEETYPDFAAEAIFVAGDRVITDPMAVPFSMGRNLLCIYSKRHINDPPEKKLEKQQHNQRTMKLMKDLLSEGGKCIYVAPSGGRDRPNDKGEVSVSAFDPQSVEMFRLMAKQAKRPTHFYPLALATYDILPPPQTVESELGERRQAKRGGALFSFGDEIEMDQICQEIKEKEARRLAQATFIWNLVNNEYNLLRRKPE